MTNRKAHETNFNRLLTDMNNEDISLRKSEAFDKIAALFYEGNFGTANKSEIELQMFSIFMEAMIDAHTENGVLDYAACSDYKIGKILGIPQEKVRTLKIKKHARYPIHFDWRESLKTIQNEIVYDGEKKKIIIPVRDPNLYNEIREFIDDNGGYIEIQRGKNVIQIRPEYFFLLLYKATDTEKERKKIREEFSRQLKKRNEDYIIDKVLTEKEMESIALSQADEFFEFAKEIAKGIDGIREHPLVSIISGIQCICRGMNKK